MFLLVCIIFRRNEIAWLDGFDWFTQSRLDFARVAGQLCRNRRVSVSWVSSATRDQSGEESYWNDVHAIRRFCSWYGLTNDTAGDKNGVSRDRLFSGKARWA